MPQDKGISAANHSYGLQFVSNAPRGKARP